MNELNGKTKKKLELKHSKWIKRKWIALSSIVKVGVNGIAVIKLYWYVKWCNCLGKFIYPKWTQTLKASQIYSLHTTEKKKQQQNILCMKSTVRDVRQLLELFPSFRMCVAQSKCNSMHSIENLHCYLVMRFQITIIQFSSTWICINIYL